MVLVLTTLAESLQSDAKVPENGSDRSSRHFPFTLNPVRAWRTAVSDFPCMDGRGAHVRSLTG